jgi:hypothetical protein
MLKSGIQEPSGGIARYYRSDLARNNPVSTEITGYGVSALCYLHQLTGEAPYLDGARRAGLFLTRQAWNADLGIFPFEWFADADQTAVTPAYFFDCGIIVRGLLKLWHATGEREFRDVARACGESMAVRFAHRGNIAPILHLPSFEPFEYGGSWSNNPGCYQLKSALAWLELFEETGDSAFRSHFESALDLALGDAPSFLPGTHERLRVMDRLHAFSYFLEALIPVAAAPRCRAALEDGIARLSHYLRSIRADFVRSDVYAQLLRVRLYAHRAGYVPLDENEAAEEAAAIPAFQYDSQDPRMSGGFSFGRRQGADLPYANPVSTAFCLQAAAMWDARHERLGDHWRTLI